MKDLFNPKMINDAARVLAKHDNQFDQSGFVRAATQNIEQLELKQRSDQICQALITYLSEDYLIALNHLITSLKPVEPNMDLREEQTDNTGIAGWFVMPMTQFVSVRGHEHFSASLEALAAMTRRFTSEFGVRSFFIADPTATLIQAASWCEHECHHVRRLASEGSRPLLPWAEQIPQFKNEPRPLFSLLEKLLNDPSEYVRRSVANNLNDIAKHHPDLVADWVDERYQSTNSTLVKTLRHASRTLIKQGHKRSLATFGYLPPECLNVELFLSEASIKMSEHIEIELTVSNPTAQTQSLLIDYVVFHKKANGKLAPKVFKWKTLKIGANDTLKLTKKHAIKPITTRKYYSGEHQIAVQINGEQFPPQSFNLEC